MALEFAPEGSAGWWPCEGLLGVEARASEWSPRGMEPLPKRLQARAWNHTHINYTAYPLCAGGSSTRKARKSVTRGICDLPEYLATSCVLAPRAMTPMPARRSGEHANCRHWDRQEALVANQSTA